MKITLAGALALAFAAAAGVSAARTPSSDPAASPPARPDMAAPATPAPPTAAAPAATDTTTATAPPPAPAEMTPSAAAATLSPSPGASAAAQPPVVANPAHGLVQPPPAGRGQVVFFRNSSLYGAAVWYTVKENGHKLGDLSNGAFFALPVDPGLHVFTAATENKDTLRIEVEAGETYYVRGTVHMGLLVGEASIAPSDEASFEKVFKHLHPAKTWPVEASAADTAKPAAPDAKP
ncbi:MAG TPA: DUF2846 domain-containing protein [Caulobacteraceae bacterium]|nr:DUF2846 domain-containing protein [Caulobacteraceae bacterium]